jgi:O-antigen ligase/tetratricopeptide (TPR) repeat protein
MDSASHGSSRLEHWAEVLSLALVSLAPWAFGAVEAWAELALELGIAALAAMAVVAGWRAGRRPQLLSMPSAALLGLIGLAFCQAAPLRGDWLRRLAPAAAEARASLAPATATRVLGDDSAAVAPPSPTLSANRDETFRAAARLTAAWVLFQAVLALGGGPAALRRLGLVLAGNAALLALFALIQALSWNGKIYWVRPSPMLSGWNSGGPFVGHSPLAAELNLGLGFALAFLLTPSRTRRFRPWAAYVASVIAVGVVASHSRTGFLAMAAAMAVMALGLRSARNRAGAGIGIGLAAILVLIPVFLIATGQTSPFSRIGTIAETSSYSPRLEIWKRSIDAWLKRPLLGWGLGTFASATSPFFTRDEGVVYTRAENEYLDMLVEEGAVGLGMMALFLVALVRSGRAALARATAPRDRLVVLGALFGLLTLAIHSLSDFAVHIPAVGITAVVLAARITALGAAHWRTSDPPFPPFARGGEDALERASEINRPPLRRGDTGGFAAALAGLATLVPIVLVSVQGMTLARAEFAMARTGLPLPGSGLPEAQAANVVAADLPERRAALAEALALRPDWAEGHLRLGLTYLGLYRAQAQEWLQDAAGGSEQAAMLAGPMWLHGVVHGRDDVGRLGPGARALLDQEPIRKNLVPATRSFLEARRCCPTLALAHAELAQLDFLIEHGEPVSVHAARALRLGRGSAEVLVLAAQAAFQAGDADLACDCWRAALAARPESWVEIADQVGVVLPPDQVLSRILTPGSGQHLVHFAERLYAEPEDAEVRTRYMGEALKRLDHEVRLPEPERCQLVARAAAVVGARGLARTRMQQALRLEPTHSDWRQQFVLWLIEWGDPAEARRQAQVGLHLEPENWRLRQALEAAAEALAQGSAATDTAVPRLADDRE